MLNRNDVSRILSDLVRTELARHRADALAVFETGNGADLLSRLPRELLGEVFKKAAALFGYAPREFSTFDLMTNYAYASFAKTGSVTFLTSGSTGAPKKCVHTREMIEEEAYGVAPVFNGVKRVVSLVPASHLYGFTFTVALPHVLAVPVLTLPALPTQSWDTLLQEGDLVVGFPLFWGYFLRMQAKLPHGVQVLSSTAPCKDEIIRGLYSAGAAQFTEIYGASETGAMGFRHQAGEPFELLPFWEIDTKENQPKIRRRSQPEWLLLPDYVDVSADGRFLRPLRRQDACVQVAGVNVYPKHVEEVLEKHPAVKACRVRLMRPEEGERLKAFIVLNEGYTPEHLGIIRTYLAQRLTVHELPRTFTFGAELPASALGKNADW